MNKIERAIRDVKMEIKRMQNEKVVIVTKLEAYEKHLESLEAIQNDNSIPYSDDKITSTNRPIIGVPNWHSGVGTSTIPCSDSINVGFGIISDSCTINGDSNTPTSNHLLKSYNHATK